MCCTFCQPKQGDCMSIMLMVRVKLAKQGTWPLCIRRLLHFVSLRMEELEQKFLGEVTPEGVRVMIYGTLETAPKAVTTKRGSPLQFFLLEYDPEKPQEPIRHDVWARKKARDDLHGLKLKKGDSIEAVLYRHTWEVPLQGGGIETHTRHNLSTITRVQRIGTAKRKIPEQ